MFRNMLVYVLPAPWNVRADALCKALREQQFSPGMSGSMQSCGWVSPRKHGDLVHQVGQQFLLEYVVEKKLLPASVITQVVKARVEDIEEKEGRKVGKRQKKELKEQVTDELLPEAFAIQKKTQVWIDPVNGWLVIDTSSTTKGAEILSSFYKAITQFPVSSIRTEVTPKASMTEWLANDEAPYNFTIDDETELCSAGEGKATVRFLRHALDADDMRRHVASGKRCTRLAMTWTSRISFVLTDNWILKSVKALDVLKQPDDVKDAEELADSEFAMMAGETQGLLKDLVQAMGGLALEDANGQPVERKVA
jgi:recombination associated protein RdgC